MAPDLSVVKDKHMIDGVMQHKAAPAFSALSKLNVYHILNGLVPQFRP